MKYLYLAIIISFFIVGCAEKEEKTESTDSATATSKIIVYAVNYSVGGE